MCFILNQLVTACAPSRMDGAEQTKSKKYYLYKMRMWQLHCSLKRMIYLKQTIIFACRLSTSATDKNDTWTVWFMIGKGSYFRSFPFLCKLYQFIVVVICLSYQWLFHASFDTFGTCNHLDFLDESHLNHFCPITLSRHNHFCISTNRNKGTMGNLQKFFTKFKRKQFHIHQPSYCI